MSIRFPPLFVDHDYFCIQQQGIEFGLTAAEIGFTVVVLPLPMRFELIFCATNFILADSYF